MAKVMTLDRSTLWSGCKESFRVRYAHALAGNSGTRSWFNMFGTPMWISGLCTHGIPVPCGEVLPGTYCGRHQLRHRSVKHFGALPDMEESPRTFVLPPAFRIDEDRRTHACGPDTSRLHAGADMRALHTEVDAHVTYHTLETQTKSLSFGSLGN